MLARKATDQLVVEVPTAAQDRPPWRTVGIIAAVGLLVGIVWPRLAGVRLGPSLPEASSAASTTAAPIEATPPAPPPASHSAAAAATPAPTAVASHSAVSPAISALPAVAPPAAPAAPVAHSSERTTPVEVAPAAHSSGNPSEGTAQVVYETALVRDTPKTGKIIARLPRGTTIRVGPVKDGWYPVKPGNGFAGEGWVFRGAIGR
jgi:hypothetical protein